MVMMVHLLIFQCIASAAVQLDQDAWTAACSKHKDAKSCDHTKKCAMEDGVCAPFVTWQLLGYDGLPVAEKNAWVETCARRTVCEHPTSNCEIEDGKCVPSLASFRHNVEDQKAAASAGAVPAAKPTGKASRKVVKVPGWPDMSAFPLSPGIIHNDILYVSGFPGMDLLAKPPAIVPGGIYNQTLQALKNVGAVVAAANSTLADVLECTVLMSDLSMFETMNKAYAAMFPAEPPARAAFQVAALGGAGSLVEIKCSCAV